MAEHSAPEMWLQSDSGAGWVDVAEYDNENELRDAVAYWTRSSPAYRFRGVRRFITWEVLA